MLKVVIVLYAILITVLGDAQNLPQSKLNLFQSPRVEDSLFARISSLREFFASLVGGAQSNIDEAFNFDDLEALENEFIRPRALQSAKPITSRDCSIPSSVYYKHRSCTYLRLNPRGFQKIIRKAACVLKRFPEPSEEKRRKKRDIMNVCAGNFLPMSLIYAYEVGNPFVLRDVVMNPDLQEYQIVYTEQCNNYHDNCSLHNIRLTAAVWGVYTNDIEEILIETTGYCAMSMNN